MSGRQKHRAQGQGIVQNERKFPQGEIERGWGWSKEWTSEQRKDFEEMYIKGSQGTLF